MSRNITIYAKQFKVPQTRANRIASAVKLLATGRHPEDPTEDVLAFKRTSDNLGISPECLIELTCSTEGDCTLLEDTLELHFLNCSGVSPPLTDSLRRSPEVCELQAIIDGRDCIAFDDDGSDPLDEFDATAELFQLPMGSEIGALSRIDAAKHRINGYIVAEAGNFKDRNGYFDLDSLAEIIRLGNAEKEGLRTRLSHPSMFDDGVTRFLGRSTNFVLEQSLVRADLQISNLAMSEPVGGGRPIGDYVLAALAEDKGSLSASLVMKTRKERTAKGLRFFPERLFAADIVGDGAAIHQSIV